MIVDHIGIVVRSLEDGIKQWEELFRYSRVTEIILNTRQKVKVVFMTKANSITIKLIEPTEHESPVFQFAQRGGGLHHLCFRCDNLETQISILKDKGARSLIPPEPGEAFENNNIAFLILENNLNLELIDTDKKTGWTNSINQSKKYDNTEVS